MKMRLYLSILLSSFLVSCIVNKTVKSSRDQFLGFTKEQLSLMKEDQVIDSINNNIIKSFSIVSKTTQFGGVFEYSFQFPLKVKVKLRDFKNFPHLSIQLRSRYDNNMYIYKLNSGNLISSSLTIGKSGNYIFQVNSNPKLLEFLKQEVYFNILNSKTAFKSDIYPQKKLLGIYQDFLVIADVSKQLTSCIYSKCDKSRSIIFKN